EAEVDVRRGRVDAELDAQRPAELQLALELTLGQQVDGMTREVQLPRRLLEMLDLEWLQLVGRLEPEHLREEREMGCECALHVFRFAEAVSLALESDVRVRDPALLQRLDDDLRLSGRHHLVVEPLEKQERP